MTSAVLAHDVYGHAEHAHVMHVHVIYAYALDAEAMYRMFYIRVNKDKPAPAVVVELVVVDYRQDSGTTTPALI
jgi:hypothetical protein